MNCKNCGAPLSKDGYCDYCGSWHCKISQHDELTGTTLIHPTLRLNSVGIVKNNFLSRIDTTNIIRTRLRDICYSALKLGEIQKEDFDELNLLFKKYYSFGGNSYINVLVKKCEELPIIN